MKLKESVPKSEYSLSEKITFCAGVFAFIPTLGGLGGSEFYFSPSIMLIGLILLITLFKEVRYSLILLTFITLISALFSTLYSNQNVFFISIIYYLASFYLVTTRFILKEKLIRKIIEIGSFIILFSIILDYVNYEILSFFSGFERRIDSDFENIVQRNFLNISRPVGLFRESAELGIAIGCLCYANTYLKHRLPIYLFFVLAVLSLSATAFLLILVVLLLRYKNPFLIGFFFLCAAILFISRLQQLDLQYLDIDYLMSINLSIIKRFLHPLVATYELFVQADIYQVLFGYMPGGYKDELIRSYYWLEFSDLSRGFILNGMANFLLSFGILGFMLVAIVLIKTFSFAHLTFIFTLLSLGAPLITPVFLVVGLRVHEK